MSCNDSKIFGDITRKGSVREKGTGVVGSKKVMKFFVRIDFPLKYTRFQ